MPAAWMCPKKVFVGVAELVDWSRRMEGKGIFAPGLSISWPDLIAFKRTFTDPAPAQNEKSFTEAGIITRHGRARFVDRTTIEVGNDLIKGRHVVIATGARHATLGIRGEEHLTTSTSAALAGGSARKRVSSAGIAGNHWLPSKLMKATRLLAAIPSRQSVP